MEQSRPNADEKTSMMLGAWAANSFAILAANLRARELISEDLITHFQTGLRQMEDELSGEAYEAVDHIDFVLEGDWIRDHNPAR